MFIASHRKKTAVADNHNNSGAEFKDLYEADQYKKHDSFYFLSQTDLLKEFNNKWSRSLSYLMTPIVDDKIRVAGILITDEDMRDLLPAILGKSRSGTRLQLDATHESCRPQ